MPCPNFDHLKVVTNGLGDELRTIVTPNMGRYSSTYEKVDQRVSRL